MTHTLKTSMELPIPRGEVFAFFADAGNLHLFQEMGSKTTISDEVRYRLPLWPLGEIAHPLVRAQPHRIIRHRQEAIRACFAR